MCVPKSRSNGGAGRDRWVNNVVHGVKYLKNREESQNARQERGDHPRRPSSRLQAQPSEP